MFIINKNTISVSILLFSWIKVHESLSIILVILKYINCEKGIQEFLSLIKYSLKLKQTIPV